jgi:transcriptional regulator with XRE-family HTH domain
VKDAITELIGRRCVARRLQRGLTQAQVAAKVGISHQALSEIERGNQAPKWETIYALSKALVCEVWDLIPTLNQVRLIERARALEVR